MFDLHVHTTASDGELDCKGIIQEAIKNGVTKIAITDHDTVQNVKGCIEEGNRNGVLVIPGIEISAEYSPGQMHILGLGIDIDNKEFNAVMEILRKSREAKNLKTIAVLKEQFGIELSMEEIKKYSVGESLGRPHFAKAMIEKGIVSTVKEAFSNYLAKPCINNIKKNELEPQKAIKLINNAGGVAILAHPISLKLSPEDTYKKILELKSYGLNGIEVYHSDHSSGLAEFYRKIAEKEGLLITCGSDFHGRGIKPEIELGKGINSNLPTDNDEIFYKFYRNLNKDIEYYDY